MEILGIGPLELFFILIIALIVLGPNDMVKAGRTLGRFLRKIVTSPAWHTVQNTSRELRYLPNRLIREAGLEEIKESLPDPKQIQKDMGLEALKDDLPKWKAGISDWTTPPPEIDSPPLEEGKILPPSSAASDDVEEHE